jgi:hypothetical protein
MDIKWMLLLLAVLYLVPELLKRRHPKKYEYPEIPSQAPPAEPMATPVQEIEWSPQSKLKAAKTTDLTTTSPVMELTDISESETAWQGKLSHSEVVNGFIFAEILQPPRAQRPMAFRQSRQGKIIDEVFPGV